MDAQTLHKTAMELAERAFFARLHGKAEEALRLLRQAYDNERKAAESLSSRLDLEPSRSVIHRSAASLATDCGEYREAERLIATALSGSPPDELAEELRDLLDTVNFQRHLKLRGVELVEDELQLSIVGRVIGSGMAALDEFLGRVQAVQKLILRTAERRQGLPFREKGPPKKPVRKQLELYMSAPRNGSMAVSFKLGAPTKQLAFPSLNYPRDTIDGLLTSLKLLSEGQGKQLRVEIPDKSYYINFVGLTRAIAPDGDRVKQIGFTVVRQGLEKYVALTKPFDQYRVPFEEPGLKPPEKEDIVKVQGRLLFADSIRPTGKIKLIDEKEKQHTIVVPEGMMADIVRPLWEYIVLVSGVRLSSGAIQLQDIKRAPQ